MTFEEITQTMEFIVRQQASFWAGMEEQKTRNAEFLRGLQDLKEQTSRFEAWAAEVVAIQSRRLDEHDRQFEQRDRQFKEQMQAAEKQRQEDAQFRHDVMRALNLILSRLFPSNN